MDDLEWFADPRVWVLVAVMSIIIIPFLFKQMINDLNMPKWKAIIVCLFAIAVSYIPGKIIIDKA